MPDKNHTLLNKKKSNWIIIYFIRKKINTEVNENNVKIHMQRISQKIILTNYFDFD